MQPGRHTLLKSQYMCIQCTRGDCTRALLFFLSLGKHKPCEERARKQLIKSNINNHKLSVQINDSRKWDNSNWINCSVFMFACAMRNGIGREREQQLFWHLVRTLSSPVCFCLCRTLHTSNHHHHHHHPNRLGIICRKKPKRALKNVFPKPFRVIICSQEDMLVNELHWLKMGL